MSHSRGQLVWPLAHLKPIQSGKIRARLAVLDSHLATY